MHLIRTSALWLSPLAWALSVTATCYYPDGSVAGTYNWVPCKSTVGTASTCCIPNEGDVCMADGLCNWVGHYYFRGACTDQSWKDGSCAQVCQGNSPSNYIQLQKCTSGEYCCGSSCCTDGSFQFALNSTATVAFTSTTTSSTSRTTTSTKTTSTTSRTTSTSLSRTGTVSSSGGVTATAASATSTSGSTSSGGGDGGGGNKDLGVAIGVGLGGSLVGVACAVAVFFFIRRDRKKKQEAAEAGLLPSSAPGNTPISPSTEVPPLASPAPTYQSPYPSPYPTPAPAVIHEKDASQG